jgi:uncharacterized protein
VAPSEYQTLLAVQARDTTIDQLRHRHETLPDRAERQRLLDQRNSLTTERADIATRRDDIAGREDELESELAKSEERMKLLDTRLYSGEVSATRDLQAISGEIENLKAFGSQLEDKALALLEEREPLDAALRTLDAQLAQIDVDLNAVDGRIVEAEVAIEADLAVELGARDELVTGVSPALLDRYESLRKRLAGVGAAPLNGASCGGCHLTLPASEVARIKREPPEALILCDQCGRILVRPD